MSDKLRESGEKFLGDVIGVFMRDPTAAWALFKDLRALPSTIRDEIFFESLGTYILNTYEYNEVTQRFESRNLRSLAAALAEASPNAEAGYEGDPEKLEEYAKRLIKLLDDCGTKQKAFYLANITRALLGKLIDTQKFFQLSRCIRNLTEEDLLFLSEHISEGTIPRGKDYIDDYRALGLLYEVQEGFAYTPRAFALKKYALCYEQNVQIPNHFLPHFEPMIGEVVDEEMLSFSKAVEQVKENQEWKEFP